MAYLPTLWALFSRSGWAVCVDPCILIAILLEARSPRDSFRLAPRFTKRFYGDDAGIAAIGEIGALRRVKEPLFAAALRVQAQPG
jgi:hypothetical protein